MAILLIRHGETESNAERILQTPEIPLNSRGEEQARLLAKRLAGQRIAAIVASDLVRAAMTAAEIGRVAGLSIEYDPGLQERNFGKDRGRPYREVGDIFAPSYEPLEGESWARFDQRVDAAWARVTARARELDGDLAVVTHGLFCRSLSSRLLTVEPAPESHSFLNTSLTVIDPTPPFRVQLFNCCAHLESGIDS